jgi:hypothetical protein
MSAFASRRSIGVMIAAAALCAALMGCISDLQAATPKKDIQAATPKKSDGKGQMRYYGGPKSPMWSSQ